VESLIFRVKVFYFRPLKREITASYSGLHCPIITHVIKVNERDFTETDLTEGSGASLAASSDTLIPQKTGKSV